MEITLAIKTFERRDCLYALLKSISDFGLNYPIYIADDSSNPLDKAFFESFNNLKISYWHLPFNSGISKGRNYLLDKIKTKYFVLLDDDFIFYEKTNIEQFLNILTESNFDLLGGVFYNIVNKAIIFNVLKGFAKRIVKRNPIYFPYISRSRNLYIPKLWEGYINHFENRLRCLPLINYKGAAVKCDITHNFFIANTKKIKAIKWDDEFKVEEHLDFFLRAKGKELNVGTTHNISILHTPSRPSNYKKYRFGKSNYYKQLFMKKHKLSSFQNLDRDIFYLKKK